MKLNAAILGASALVISILTGCGRMGIQAPSTVTQSAKVRPDRAGSWMAPEAKSEDLIYVTTFDVEFMSLTIRKASLSG